MLPKYPDSVLMTSCVVMPARWHWASSMSTLYCGNLELNDVYAIFISGRLLSSARKSSVTLLKASMPLPLRSCM